MKMRLFLREWKVTISSFAVFVLVVLPGAAPALDRAGDSSSDTPSTDYIVADTGQSKCYNTAVEIGSPAAGEAFYGQDAQYYGPPPRYNDNGNGTVLDLTTGLTWMASPDADGDGVLESPGDKLSWWDAMEFPNTLNEMNYGGYDDWRLPSIKELYSLIDFSGVDPSGLEGDTTGLIPFIGREYFGFVYGNEDAGERIIDSQYWSSTEYVSTTMGGDHTVFGVNFADGRIKGYGTSLHGDDKVSFALCCRGNIGYGTNDFTDNGDGTVTDAATGLMWQQADNGAGKTWKEALSYAENLVLAGHDDWRLPNAKELQSILDYTRSPATHGTAAIDPVFTCTAIADEGGGVNYPFYWAGTTHANWSESPGYMGAYVCFGEALGWMQSPFPPYEYTLMDVHGAGAQRSDPKYGDPDDWPYGHGPQGDVVRIYNHSRCVRGGLAETPVPDVKANGSDDPVLLSPGSTATITIALEPGDFTDRDADWWVFADTPFGTYSYIYPSGWERGFFRSFGYELLQVPSFEVLDGVLPAGDYTIYFAVDDNEDGEFDGAWTDSVEVTVQS